MLKDMQADLKTDENNKAAANPDDKKRTYDSAFEGTSETGNVETKKPRRSDQAELEADGIICPNETELVDQENESNSINDASDALSEEDEHIVQPKASGGASSHRQRPPRETVIDDDIIIEENSNDFKAEEEMSNQMTENSVSLPALILICDNQKKIMALMNSLCC